MLRYALLSWPLVFAGRYLAPEFGIDPAIGMALGTILAAAAASFCTVLLVSAALRRPRVTDRARIPA